MFQVLNYTNFGTVLQKVRLVSWSWVQLRSDGHHEKEIEALQKDKHQAVSTKYYGLIPWKDRDEKTSRYYVKIEREELGNQQKTRSSKPLRLMMHFEANRTTEGNKVY